MTKINYGDKFQIGDHILVCGDALDPKIVEKAIGESKINAFISDIPYGIDYTASKKGFSQVKVDKDILNDGFVSEKQYAKFVEDLIALVIPCLTRKNSFYIFNSDKQIFALREGMEKSGVHFSQLLIWIKNHAVIGRKDYLPMHELIAVGWFGVHEFRKSQDKSVLFCPKPNKSALHPTQKPLSLMRRLILNSTSIGDVVYEPCAGSGSTGIACEQTKRKCIMIELDPEYCRTIIERFSKLGVKVTRAIDKDKRDGK
ncbi:MAG: site-specific DNA-methyltransferase [Candidatus Moranbacteria bacterium]|nr:site-specific DNA-methyltransferase [Candidatus Moranbacteria bacterium]